MPYGIVFAAAISGLGVIALMIGYLPTLYAAFNRRETLVTMLEALSGKPPWGPELLARQQLIGNTCYLPKLATARPTPARHREPGTPDDPGGSPRDAETPLPLPGQ